MGVNESKSKKTIDVKKYSIIKEYIVKNEIIHTGLNGNILLCHPKNNKEIKRALKILYYKNYDEKVKAIKEFQLQSKVSNDTKNVVKIYDVYKINLEGHKAFLVVMEYIDGGKLIDFLRRNINKLTEKYSAYLMSQMCHAVKKMHDLDIAHRSLNLDNILIDKDDNIKITHFGLANDVSKNVSSNIKDTDQRRILLEGLRKNEFAVDINGLGHIMKFLCYGLNYDNKKNDKTENEQIINKVSDDAKTLLKGMLNENIYQKYEIDDIINTSWIKNNDDIPETPLENLKNILLIENTHKLVEEMNYNIEKEAEQSRVFNTVTLKNVNKIKNKLYERRLKSKFKDPSFQRHDLYIKPSFKTQKSVPFF